MNQYFRAISANLVYFTVNVLIFLLITPLSIRVMGHEFFGLWSMLNALMLMTGIGTLGISSIVNKYSSEEQAGRAADRKHSDEVITAGILIVLPMAVVTAGLLALTRGFMTRHLQVSPALQTQFGIAILLAAAGIFPQFLAKVPQGFLLSRLKNSLVRLIETCSSLALWAGAILIAFFRRDLAWIALWCLANSLLTMLVYFLTLQQTAGYRPRLNKPLIRSMTNFSGYMFIESMAIALFQQLDRIIVGFTLGPAAAGVYSVGTSAGLRMAIVSGQVTEVMIPYASRKDSIHAGERLYAVFRQLSRTISLLVAALGGLLVIWMDEILSLWISPGYASAYSGIFRLMIVAYGILSLSRPAHQTLTGIGQVRFTSLVYLVTALAMLAALYVLSLRLGFLGAALANFIPLLLLSFNLYTYQRLAQRIVWRQVFGDLVWGLSVPLVLLLLVSLGPTSWMKVLWTALLGLLLALIAFKDEGLRLLLAGRMRRFAPK